MNPLTILMTNTWLVRRGGSELYIRDLAIALKKKGHRPLVFSPQLGEVSDEIRLAGIEVSDQLSSFPVNIDLIHGQHHLESLTALMYFQNTPAIFICHGAKPWEEQPPRFPRIAKYCAVDHACVERVLRETGTSRDQIAEVLNFVDLERFKLKPQVAAKPRRALLFHSMATRTTLTPVVEAACRQTNLELDVIGYRAGNPCKDPENLLPQYDLVFATGRSALEAMACGCAVILFGGFGSGPLVTPTNFGELRPWNFGFRVTPHPHHPDLLVREIQSYRMAEVQAVSQRIRSEAGLEPVVSRWETLYREAVEWAQPFQARGWDRLAEGHALAAYLQAVSLHYKAVNNHLANTENAKNNLEEQVARVSKLRVVRLRNWVRGRLGLPV